MNKYKNCKDNWLHEAKNNNKHCELYKNVEVN